MKLLRYKHSINVFIIFAVVSVLFFKIAFLDRVPANAGDTNQWRASAQVQIDHEKDTGKPALWNSNIFSGMPGFLISYKSAWPFLDNVKTLTDHIINWRILYLIFGGLGVYALLNLLGFEPLLCLMGGLFFALSSHQVGLIEIGHNTKLRAIELIPWVFYGVTYLYKKRNLLGIGLTGLFMITQLRENHPQIAYYTFLSVGIFWLVMLGYAIKERDLKNFLLFTFYLLIACGISGLAVLNPYLAIKEYGEYSIRGGQSGLSYDYATSWSFNPKEIITFFIPDYYGGVSPYYWGTMPFTQVYNYMGAMVMVFAVIALKSSFKNKTVLFLVVTSLLALVLSFGRHFNLLTEFMLNYFPYWNKFRVPATTLIIPTVTCVVLAAYGLKTVLTAKGNPKAATNARMALMVAIGLFLIFILSRNYFASLDMFAPREAARYRPEQLDYLKNIRLEKLMNDGKVFFGLAIFLFILMYYYLKGKISRSLFVIGVILLGCVDLMRIDNRFLDELMPKTQADGARLPTEMDNFLASDSTLFRIYPLGADFGQNSWAAHNQTIGGYHGAKLQRYQEIVENCLNKPLTGSIPLNWNIINMLNVKYYIFKGELPVPTAEKVYTGNEAYAYKNLTALNRAWFVDSTLVIADKEKIFATLNSEKFDPQTTAILEKNVEGVTMPDSSFVKNIDWDTDEFTYRVFTDKPALLVISEIYYPAGWVAYLDGQAVAIEAVNYILRGVKVPQGEHELKMVFAPESHYKSKTLSLVGIILCLAAVLGGVILRKKNEA